MNFSTQNIGQQIKSIRKEAKLTQLQLAKSCNLSVRTIKSFEKGDSNPGANELFLIAEACGKNLELLFHNKDV